MPFFLLLHTFSCLHSSICLNVHMYIPSGIPVVVVDYWLIQLCNTTHELHRFIQLVFTVHTECRQARRSQDVLPRKGLSSSSSLPSYLRTSANISTKEAVKCELATAINKLGYLDGMEWISVARQKTKNNEFCFWKVVSFRSDSRVWNSSLGQDPTSGPDKTCQAKKEQHSQMRRARHVGGTNPSSSSRSETNYIEERRREEKMLTFVLLQNLNKFFVHNAIVKRTTLFDDNEHQLMPSRFDRNGHRVGNHSSCIILIRTWTRQPRVKKSV